MYSSECIGLVLLTCRFIQTVQRLIVNDVNITQSQLARAHTHTQGKVFGAGYPSLPAMSVQEFFDQQYKEQLEKQRQEMAAAPQKSRVSDDEGEGKDEETEESMKRAREFDEFKDCKCLCPCTIAGLSPSLAGL